VDNSITNNKHKAPVHSDVTAAVRVY